jgi:hypothetical protein
MSRKLALGLALAFGAGLPPAGSAQAGLSDRALVAPLPDQLLPLENVEFIYNGRQYCWHEDGWRGPGWYWCGRAYHEGVGWGGAYGWNGWLSLRGGGYYHGEHYRRSPNDHVGAHL